MLPNGNMKSKKNLGQGRPPYDSNSLSTRFSISIEICFQPSSLSTYIPLYTGQVSASMAR